MASDRLRISYCNLQAGFAILECAGKLFSPNKHLSFRTPWLDLICLVSEVSDVNVSLMGLRVNCALSFQAIEDGVVLKRGSRLLQSFI